jgi:hypothetical protein
MEAGAAIAHADVAKADAVIRAENAAVRKRAGGKSGSRHHSRRGIQKRSAIHPSVV